MNKTVNLEIKGQLAKLLATEDLIIENKHCLLYTSDAADE